MSKKDLVIVKDDIDAEVKPKFIVNDIEIYGLEMDMVAYEAKDINISVLHSEEKSFTISIFDRSTDMMRYYDVKDGKLFLNTVENLDTDEIVTVDTEVVKEASMLRDDIRDKVTELLIQDFTWLEGSNEGKVEETDELQKRLSLDAVDITAFSDTLIREFDLGSIEFSKVMEWEIVEDIVDYIEDNLECALHDMENQDDR